MILREVATKFVVRTLALLFLRGEFETLKNPGKEENKKVTTYSGHKPNRLLSSDWHS